MVRVAILGCGRIAKRHSELLGLNKIKNAKLIAVCDLVEERAQKIGNKFNVPYYKDMNLMLENEKIVVKEFPEDEESSESTEFISDSSFDDSMMQGEFNLD